MKTHHKRIATMLLLSLVWALAFIGAVTAAGATAWIFLVGDLKPIRLEA